jgi:hypothetical protein
VSEQAVGKATVSGFGIPRRGNTHPFPGPWKHGALKTRLDLAFRGGQMYVAGPPENKNGNSGLKRLKLADAWRVREVETGSWRSRPRWGRSTSWWR